MKLLTILGARPQFIKAAAVTRHLRDHYAGRVEERYLHTGQHYDDALDAVFFRELDLPTPALNLGVGSGTPGRQIATMLDGIEAHLLADRPDAVLVYGDTNSTLAGALAASRHHIPVAHVEAGLRSGDKRMQEESNRLLTDHVSTFLFAPTPTGVTNLVREGFRPEGEGRSADAPLVLHAGDVMLDNVIHYRDRAASPAVRLPEAFALVTVHRAEIVRDPAALDELCRALLDFASARALPLVLPLHPATRARLDEGSPAAAALLREAHVIEPVSYLAMLALLDRAACVLTDSGGLQKEAAFMGRPCLVLRPTTEWTELVEAGVCVVAGTTRASVAEAAWPEGDPDRARSAFGDGQAAARICEAITNALG